MVVDDKGSKKSKPRVLISQKLQRKPNLGTIVCYEANQKFILFTPNDLLLEKNT